MFETLKVRAMRFETVARAGTVLLVACGLLAGSGCERKKADPVEKTEAQPVEEPKSEATPQEPKTVEERLALVAANCSVDTQTGVISRCKNNEKQTLVRDINTGKVPRAEVLPVLVASLSPAEGDDEQKQRSVVASKTLESAFRNSWGDKPEEVATKEVAKQLIEVVPKLPSRQAAQVVPSAVHAAMLTGQQPELYAMLDALPNVDLRAAGYSFVLRYGSLTELGKLKTLIQGPEEVVATSAVEALRRLPSPNDEQKKQVCELLQTLSNDTRPVVAGKVATQLVNCGSAAVDALLAQADAYLKKGDVPAPFVRAFDLMCLNRGGKVIGTEAQCKRQRTWLEAVVANNKVNVEARQAALLGLGLQFPDEATEKLANKHANDDKSELKSVAQRVVRNIVAKRERLKGNPHAAGPHAGAVASGAPASASAAPKPDTSGTTGKTRAPAASPATPQ